MSKAVYMALRWRAPISYDDLWAWERWRLARDTGWSLEYIDELTLDDMREWRSVTDGEAKADPNWRG